MAKNRLIETGVGLFVLIGFGALLFLAIQVSGLGEFYQDESFEVTARFDNIGGLKTNAPVTIAGVEVGRVQDIHYDPEEFRAVATLNIQNRYHGHIPDDTFAKILTAGLLGEKYIGLQPGGSEDPLTQGGEITITQSSLVLEEIIGQFLFSKSQEPLP